jgi:hypothetical protein
MTTSERAVAAALAITFDDRAIRRQLALRHPDALERARRALDLLERRDRRRTERLTTDQ